MGLDGIEIVMKVEETFDIVIEDSEAEKIVTPGQLIELVLSKVGRTTDVACLTQRAFHLLRASLAGQLGCERNEIRRETLLISLFPRHSRKDKIRQILRDIGVNKELKLIRPIWLRALIFAVMLVGGISVAVLLTWHPVPSRNNLINMAYEMPFSSGFLFFGAFGCVAFLATREMRTDFWPSMTNVGQFSRWIVANSPDLVKTPPGQWSREQVSEITRLIVIDLLACEKEYREDANFVKDLGLS
jgi:hypothetical protein